MTGKIHVLSHPLAKARPGRPAPARPPQLPIPAIEFQEGEPSGSGIVRRILSLLAPVFAPFARQTPPMPDIEPQLFFPDAPSSSNGCGSNPHPRQPLAAEDVGRNGIPAHGCLPVRGNEPDRREPPPPRPPAGTPAPAPEPGPTFLKVYRGLATSGLLAQLTGSELKVLLALGLEANVLGGTPAAERTFQRLQALGAVTPADRGCLFCHLDRAALARRTGLTTRTVTAATNALVARGLVAKRAVRAGKDRQQANVYFIQPASNLAKFHSDQLSPPGTNPGLHQGKKDPPVATRGKEPPVAFFTPKKKSSRCCGVDEDPDSRGLARAAPAGEPPSDGTPPASTRLHEPCADRNAIPAHGCASSASAGPAGGWEADMQRVYDRLQRAGWPVDGALQTALRAKALRTHDAARQQGAAGPAWVAEAMLLALGRKAGPDGHPAPTAERLLAYADGILDNWTRQGGPRAAGQTLRRHAETPRRGVSTGHASRPPPAQTPGGCVRVRQPRTEGERLWEQVLLQLRGQMTRATFDLWLRGSQLLDLQRPDSGPVRLVVQVANPRAVAWLEHRLKARIQRTVEWHLGQEADLTFQARSQTLPSEEEAKII